MPKTISVIPKIATCKVREMTQEAGSEIPRADTERRFRDDGCCPECFAEMVYQEGVMTCHLCGYYECD